VFVTSTWKKVGDEPSMLQVPLGGLVTLAGRTPIVPYAEMEAPATQLGVCITLDLKSTFERINHAGSSGRRSMCCFIVLVYA